MKLPNRERAIIAAEKIRQYLLNVEHEKGGAKARLLNRFGYRAEDWNTLESDIRRFHLEREVETVQQTPYGMRYTIRAPLQTPNGRTVMMKTIWQIDEGTDFPRLITLFPG